MFLRNEPTVFCSYFGCNLYGMSNLWRNVTENFGGFVLENEPTGEGYLGGRERKRTQIGVKNASRRAMNGTARYLNDRHRALQSEAIHRCQGFGGRGGPQNPRFCETKPFVMLRKSYLCGTGRRSYVDYRKMTNGFVFLEMRARGEDADAMARGVFELMKAPGCLKGCWCGGRWFDRSRNPAGSRRMTGLGMTDRGGRGAQQRRKSSPREGTRPTTAPGYWKK